MEEKTRKGLHWIVAILNKHNIPYRIGGGFAASVYGSSRQINDIDISLSGEHFSVIAPEVLEYITAGPKHYNNEKWDCDCLSLNYHGQEIDMTDIDTLKMSNKEGTEWFQTKDHFRRYPVIVTKIEGVDVSIIDPRDLAAYKKHLNGDHQQVDIEAVEAYIKNQNL